MINTMKQDISKLWSQMLGKRKPSVAVVKEIEIALLSEITLSEEFIDEVSNTLVIKFNNSIIAGLLPNNGYQKLTPWGNFEKFLSTRFWEKLAEKLVVSFNEGEEVETKTAKYKKTLSKTASKILTTFVSSNSSKSNRSGGDYSELVVIKNLCSKLNLKFNYESDLKEVEAKMLSNLDGDLKKQKEDKNIILLLEGVLEVVATTNFTNITLVEWAGRDNSDSGTADIILKNETASLRISLKSIKDAGMGTLKNTGASSFESVNLDYTSVYSEMKESVISGMNTLFPTKNFSTLNDVKDFSKENEEVKKHADELSSSYLKKINALIFNHLANLDSQAVKEFFNNTILDQGSNDLWVVVANDSGSKVYNQTKEHRISETEVITFSDLTDKGFKVLKDGKRFLRVNTCCTNGKGLSAVCQRYFFDV